MARAPDSPGSRAPDSPDSRAPDSWLRGAWAPDSGAGGLSLGRAIQLFLAAKGAEAPRPRRSSGIAWCWVVLATHTSGYRSGNLGQCYGVGYIYSTASNYVDHFWKNFGYTWWYNAFNQYRSNYVSSTPTWWAVEWDHSHISSGAACTA